MWAIINLLTPSGRSMAPVSSPLSSLCRRVPAWGSWGPRGARGRPYRIAFEPEDAGTDEEGLGQCWPMLAGRVAGKPASEGGLDVRHRARVMVSGPPQALRNRFPGPTTRIARSRRCRRRWWAAKNAERAGRRFLTLCPRSSSRDTRLVILVSLGTTCQPRRYHGLPLSCFPRPLHPCDCSCD